MWNSDEFLNEDPSVSNMSSSLNIPPDYLQQFMRGESSLESLAQLRPASYNTGHGGKESSSYYYTKPVHSLSTFKAYIMRTR